MRIFWTLMLMFLVAISSDIQAGGCDDIPLMRQYEAEHKNKKEKKPYQFRTKVNLRFASNRSLIGGLNVKFRAIKVGLEFINRFRVGIMVAWLPGNAEKTDKLPVGVEKQLFEMGAFGTYFEYMFFHNYRWELSIPVDMIFADFRVTSISVYDGRETVEEFDNFPLIQIGVYGQYNVNYWLGVGTSIGGRFGVGPSSSVNNALTALYYTVGVRVMLGKFVRTVFKHQEVLKERIEYFETRRPYKADKLRKRLR